MKSYKKILQFIKRSRYLKNSVYVQGIVCYPEIKLTNEQIIQISQPLCGLSPLELFVYYRGKIHGEILNPESSFTTREDVPDFQYLFDLGVKALSEGMKL